jgi:glycosyltransferase involved in cell wall biosynthesis
MRVAGNDNGQLEPGRTTSFRVGIWCDYEHTILPDEGVGVLVYNLVQGFLAIEEPVEVVLLVKPGDQERVASFTGQHDRLRIASRLGGKPRRQFQPANLLKRWMGWADRLRARTKLYRAYLSQWLDRAGRALVKGLGFLKRRTAWEKIPMLTAAAMMLPFLAVLLWACYAIFRYALAMIQVLAFPGLIFDRVVRRLNLKSANEPRMAEAVGQLACDAWIVPLALLDHPLPFPSVVLIHDFVSSHFPNEFERWYPGYHERANRLIGLRAREATICACLSPYIRDTDLLGALNLPPSKVRMVPSAAPADFPEISDELAQRLKPSQLTRPFILLPAAFRPHKNHAGLIEALRILRDRHGNNELDLVFTGEKPGFLPPVLRRLLEDCGLQQAVHVLGKVDRRTLGALYKCAFATIVPTLYEECSFPVSEALHWGCPTACSRIPAHLELCAPLGEAMLYFDPHDPNAIAESILQIRDQRQTIRQRQRQASGVIWHRTWKDVARDFLEVCQEAAPSSLPARPEVLLFLQIAYESGVWETTKELLRALVEINRERQELTLTVGVHEDQKDTASLEQFGSELPLERFRMEVISKEEAGWFLSRASKDLSKLRPDRFQFLKGCEMSALRADAWLALTDRFEAPLLPLRPYGVIVYDMIQRYVPESFDPWFFDHAVQGMRPTLEKAHMVLVTSPATQEDVRAEYDLDLGRIRLVPVACETYRRFAALAPEAVPLPRQPFILNVGNAVAHKGGRMLLRAYARLKKQLGAQTPLLVMCGWMTHTLSPLYRGDFDRLSFQKTRRLVTKLGLKEARDVVFLGLVRDRQLLDLYQRCAVVVNAAKYDNGSFSLIEASYFGRPVVSSRYPASAYLCERFGIPAEFFPVDDDSQLAEAIGRALLQKPAAGQELEGIRLRLAASELSTRRYAERIYQCLVQLAQSGRQERAKSSLIRPAA